MDYELTLEWKLTAQQPSHSSTRSQHASDHVAQRCRRRSDYKDGHEVFQEKERERQRYLEIRTSCLQVNNNCKLYLTFAIPRRQAAVGFHF